MKAIRTNIAKVVVMFLLIFLLGCALTRVQAQAPTHKPSIVRPAVVGIVIEISGSTPYERTRLRNLTDSLNFTGQPMPGWWRICILNRADWQEDVDKYKLDTASAFTMLGQNATYVNEEYLFFGSDARVRHTLAHEAGHLICNCRSESRANSIAENLEK